MVPRAARLITAAVAALAATPPGFPSPAPPAGDAAAVGDLFVDVSAAAGLDFSHFNGMSGEFYFPEMTGQGGALFDYDNDGDLDLYLVQGALLGPGKTLADALFPPAVGASLSDRLYRTDLVSGADGRPALRLVDVTEASGVGAYGYGMGVAVGDYDNDGWADLYVTNFGSNQLLHNDGDGTFTDVTEQTGTDDPRWSTSASFVDIDSDGWLDLYVVNYVDFDLEKNPRCYAPSSRRDYCGPAAFAPLPDSLFRNLGDGRFADHSAIARIARQRGSGLGVVAADFNGDGWPDIYVANDGLPNFLWINRGDGTFDEQGLPAGVALNREGKAQASMGVDAADFDGDGDEDLFMTHLTGETNALFVNDGTGTFEDRTIETGLAAPSLPYTSFGTAWLDYDNDGWLDLLILNGAVKILEPLARAGDLFPLDQPNQLFRNVDGRRLEEVGPAAGAALAIAEVSRGAAVGDVDNDGDTDVLVLNNNGPARLLLNRVGAAHPWLGLRLLVAPAGRDLYGARVALRRRHGPPLWRRVRGDGSYCSASDPRVLVGLGEAATPESVEIRWPDGAAWRWARPVTDRYLTFYRRLGRPPALPR